MVAVSISQQENKEEMVLIYNRLLLGHEKDEILSFAVLWMDLKGIMVSEVSQIGKTNTI